MEKRWWTERVHRELGPGLLETVYEVVLAKRWGLPEENLGVLA